MTDMIHVQTNTRQGNMPTYTDAAIKTASPPRLIDTTIKELEIQASRLFDTAARIRGAKSRLLGSQPVGAGGAEPPQPQMSEMAELARVVDRVAQAANALDNESQFLVEF